MKTIKDLLELKSMRSTYLITGISSVNRTISRLDILDTPYPEVVKFLEKDEFMFTTFWNSKNDKKSRIGLVEAMIKKKCAGLGIMPELYLGSVIDNEIIELAKKHDFPILHISKESRWSEIIKEFYKLENITNKNEYIEIPYKQLFETFNKFNEDKNENKLLSSLSKILGIPILTYRDFLVNYCTIDQNLLWKIEPLIQNSVNQTNLTRSYIYTLDLYLNNYLMIHSKNGLVIASIFDNLGQTKIQFENLFKEVAEYYFDILGNTTKVSKELNKTKSLIGNYFAFLMKIDKFKHKNCLSNNLFLYKFIQSKGIAVYLVSATDIDDKELYKCISELNKTYEHRYLVYSPLELNKEGIEKVILELQKSDLELTQRAYMSIFSLSEVMLINIIKNSNYKIIEDNYNLLREYLIEDFSVEDLNTYRHYLVLKNINYVALMLDIHPNTVKYRINKIINAEKFLKLNISINFWNLEILLLVEIIVSNMI